MRRIELVLILTLMGSMCLAQENSEKSEPPEAQAQTETEQTDATKENQPTEGSDDPASQDTTNDQTKTAEDTPDRFDPTEDISEDYAVPFPVDI